jgi:arabinose-5-phosphate isomerase
MTEQEILKQAQRTLAIEAEAVSRLADRLGEEFVNAVQLLLKMEGRAVLSGIGKSGAVARKLAGTLASTGTPAFFMHPAEAMHGDLGMVTTADVVIMLSNSGETDEILNLLPAVKRRGAAVISICGRPSSTLAEEADVALDASIEQEACPLGLSPTASTTAAMALGDALAMATMAVRGFSAEDYGASHPMGTLGRKVLLRVQDLMHLGEENPTVATSATVLEALLTMSNATLRGVVSVVDEAGYLQGLFTDGDFRRLMPQVKDRNEIMEQPVSEVMTRNPTTIRPDVLAAEAANIMDEREFDNIPVVDEQGRAVGILDVQDLMKAGLL